MPARPSKPARRLWRSGEALRPSGIAQEPRARIGGGRPRLTFRGRGPSARALALVCALLVSAAAGAAETAPAGSGLDLGPGTASTPVRRSDPYVHVFGSAAVGRGLRFNNPYRLRTVLGDDAESLSLTATYADFGLGAALGEPRGLQHGAVAHLSVATDGIAQEVASLSYQALRPLGSRWLLTGRAGVPIVLEPDLNAGFELAPGAAFLVGAGAGLSSELVFSLFYGAATLERSASVIPLLSLQLGLWFDYEVLP